jgi:DNA-binding NtrC family response regulator
MSAVITVSSQDLSRSDFTPAPHDVPLNAHLENLREIVFTMMTELECLGRLAPTESTESTPVDLKDAVQRFEIELISAALEKTRGNQSKAARLLGVKHTTLNAKLKRYQIRYPQPSSETTFRRAAA